MRFLIAALIATATMASTALAQRPPSYAIPSVPPSRDPPPRFTIAPRGGALPPIGLPLPQLGLQPLPRRDGPGRHFHERGFYAWPGMVFYIPQPVVAVVPFDPPAKPMEQAPAAGRLILDVEPSGAEVFANGYYVGVPGDFSAARGGGVLAAGVHRIDLQAPGFEPAAVDLRVMPGQSVTYRGALKAMPAPAAVAPTTFYLIPGCYMGNIPPKDARLPDSCDQSQAVSWRP